MPTSVLYASTRAALAARVPDVRASQVDTLALVLVGITQSVSAHGGAIARAMPLATTPYAKEQRLRRLLDNQRVTQADHYQPIAKAALTGLNCQRGKLLIDRVLRRDHQKLLVVSSGCRRRSIPLAWTALDHRGASGLAAQQARLPQAVGLLPEGVRVTGPGDSACRNQAVCHWRRAQGHDVILGVTGGTTGSRRQEAAALGMPLVTCGGTSRAVVSLSQVYLTQERHGPVNVLAWGDTDDDGQPLVRGC